MTNGGNLYRHISFGIAVFYSLGDSGCTGIGKWPRGPAIIQSVEFSISQVYLANDLPGGSDGKEYTCNAGDQGSILGWEESLEEDMATDSSILAWRIPLYRQATVHGVAKSWTRLND